MAPSLAQGPSLAAKARCPEGQVTLFGEKKKKKKTRKNRGNKA